MITEEEYINQQLLLIQRAETEAAEAEAPIDEDYPASWDDDDWKQQQLEGITTTLVTNNNTKDHFSVEGSGSCGDKLLRPAPPTYAFDWYTLESPSLGWHWKLDFEDGELVLLCDSRGFVNISTAAAAASSFFPHYGPALGGAGGGSCGSDSFRRLKPKRKTDAIEYVRWESRNLPRIIPFLAQMDLVECFHYFLGETGNNRFPLEFRGKIADMVADVTVLIADPVNDFKVEEKQVWEEVLYSGAIALVRALCPLDDLSAATRNARHVTRFVDVIDSSGFCGAGVVRDCRDYLSHIPLPPAPLDRC